MLRSYVAGVKCGFHCTPFAAIPNDSKAFSLGVRHGLIVRHAVDAVTATTVAFLFEEGLT